MAGLLPPKWGALIGETAMCVSYAQSEVIRAIMLDNSPQDGRPPCPEWGALMEEETAVCTGRERRRALSSSLDLGF